MSHEPTTAPHWAGVLKLRQEVRSSEGSVDELQMSLHKAVYQTVDVPYRKVDYYTEITQPTPKLVGFFGRVARRLGTDVSGAALFHLDQGMGGGKSHALVGLYHMAHTPSQFFASEFGAQIKLEAEQAGGEIDLGQPTIVTLTADSFSPGRPTETFGPAVTLFERFLWSLVGGDMDAYQRYVAMGPNKETLRQALTSMGRPVLILLDELMDYVLQLSSKEHLPDMPDEQAFLSSLMDACDDVPRVAFVVVMIQSGSDEATYNSHAQEFGRFIAERVERNGKRLAVTEPRDFPSIIRKRLFEVSDTQHARKVSESYVEAAAGSWSSKVLEKVESSRGVVGFAGRVEHCYPFHPDLMHLVEEEWSKVQGFQRVRSTVAIFARTTLHWVLEHEAGRWSPDLISVGDIPLTIALEDLLSSGLLLDNNRAIQGYRAVASTDITSSDSTGGRAVSIDAALRDSGVELGQPAPAVRMATAMLCYSLVNRAQGRRGATKAELLASVFGPSSPGNEGFNAAEEVFNQLTAEEGLGALEISTPSNAPGRYYLSITQTLRMHFTAAKAVVRREDAEALVWEVAQQLAASHKGPFDQVRFIERPTDSDTSLESVFSDVDQDDNRLVVLDPRRWTLLNGKDNASRTEIRALLGVGPAALRMENAASCVVACVNTQQRDHARRRAEEVMGWKHVVQEVIDSDDADEARARLSEANKKLRDAVLKAYRHYSYLLRVGDSLEVEFRRFEDDSKSALHGQALWAQLIDNNRATARGTLGGTYLRVLLEAFDRELTPREVFQAFYKNPSFPLVSSLDEIRRAVFELVTSDWELVGADGTRLTLSSPSQLQVNSISQTLRPREATQPDPEPDPGDDTEATDSETTDSKPTDSPDDDSSAVPSPEPRVYKRYVVELRNRSIAADDNREQVWQMASELAKLLDPAAPTSWDHQLIDLKVVLTTAEGHQGGILQKAEQIGARFDIEDEEF